MAKAFTEKGFTFLFLYTREAHPGQNHGAHTSMEQKLAYAREFREQCHIDRPILVDDLSGTVHRLYGERLAPFYAEFAGYRITDPAKFQAGLHIGGQQAIDDFACMMKIWAEQARQ